ncbi:MAG: transposase [Okeania sp. SIO3B3]|nr:transposase [Okeania sp. SIO3B3]
MILFGKYYAKIDKNYTSQECPLSSHIQKKKFSVCLAFRRNRKHSYSSCGYQLNRDVAAAKVTRKRGLIPHSALQFLT